jgi:protein-S-isoprenylcysteine O-methyltransferase Ste14
MLWFYQWFFPVLWVVFLLFWQFKPGGTKTTVRLEGLFSRIVRALAFLVAIALMMLGNLPAHFLYWAIVPQGFTAFWAGAFITVLGMLFALWARSHLGANWSRSVTVKRDHELIITGPYALVRHPIYTGILTGFLGTAVAEGQVRSFIAFLLVSAVLFAKLRLEESWMRSQFGTTYETYSQHVRALVPFVL